MAKRRRLTAPDQKELEKIDESFAAKPRSGGSVTPPIAQVAGEAAVLSGMAGVGDRAEVARNSADADKWRAADAMGAAVHLVQIDAIDAGFLRRDRLIEDEEATSELLSSLRSNGLRSPIEVAELDEGYGLVSGQRRLDAFRKLAESDPDFRQIPAYVRTHETSADAYVSMIEENEIRANLTQYERGRIAVLAAQTGVFPTVEEAVNALFSASSKAKRSKIRSFARIHEALGDLLQFPTDLSERLGLKLAMSIRDGGQKALRRVLSHEEFVNASAEAKAIETCLAEFMQPTTQSRGGRPSETETLPIRSLAGGGSIIAKVSANRMVLDLRDMAFDEDGATALLDALEQYFE
jgi:ParB family chromosome partitioning protein